MVSQPWRDPVICRLVAVAYSLELVSKIFQLFFPTIVEVILTDASGTVS
jgi:hypothetical protein